MHVAIRYQHKIYICNETFLCIEMVLEKWERNAQNNHKCTKHRDSTIGRGSNTENPPKSLSASWNSNSIGSGNAIVPLYSLYSDL